MEGGFICPFVVIDSADLGETTVLLQALCLTIFNLSTMQETCLSTNGNEGGLCDVKLSRHCYFCLPLTCLEKPELRLALPVLVPGSTETLFVISTLCCQPAAPFRVYATRHSLPHL